MRTIFAAMGTAIPALMLMASPVQAEGKADRARQAIAEAQGKVQTLGALGAAGDTPRMVAQAQAALRSAQDNLKGGNKDEAIADAHRASEMADTAINLSKQAQVQANASVQADAALQAQAAETQAASAEARARDAERAAAAAQADAAAARVAPPVVVAAPEPTTVVTTETTRTAATPTRAAPRKTVTRVVKRKPVARAATRATVTERTTTTVSSR